jgi:prolyl 4-hydroxylase
MANNFLSFKKPYIWILLLTIIIGGLVYFRQKQTSETLQIHKKGNVTTYTHGEYVVKEYENLFTPEECKLMIEIGIENGMKESDVLTYGKEKDTEVNNSYRKSKQTWIPDSKHHLFEKFATVSEELTGIPKNHQEMTQVAMYDPQGKFNEHFDACVYEDKSYCDRINNNAGQRRSTLLLYLNDEFEEGETEFVNIGLKIKPKTGSAILFWNVDEKETLIQKSKHRGCVVKSGNKWIATKWSHISEWV